MDLGEVVAQGLDAAKPFIKQLCEAQSELAAVAEEVSRGGCALLLMVVLGLMLIAVIMSSVLLSAYAGALQAFPILGQWIGPAISGFTHYGILTAFFTLIYKWLPISR